MKKIVKFIKNLWFKLFNKELLIKLILLFILIHLILAFFRPIKVNIKYPQKLNPILEKYNIK
jgi:hypothetical protein